MTGNPIRRPRAPAQEPPAPLAAELHALCDLLVIKPLPRTSVLRERALSGLAACERAGETGLPAHLLRNLLRDLASQTPVDAPYYAVHLSRAASRLDL